MNFPLLRQATQRPVVLVGFVLISAAFFAHAHAAFFLSEALPNTTDDANLEYVSVSNASCVPESLSGYSLSDASGKAFVFGSSSLVEPLSALKFFRPETKITLNNENETLFLRTSSWILEDTFSYATSTKGTPVFRLPAPVFPICAIGPVESSEDVESSVVSSGSGVLSESTQESPPPEEPQSSPESPEESVSSTEPSEDAEGEGIDGTEPSEIPEGVEPNVSEPSESSVPSEGSGSGETPTETTVPSEGSGSVEGIPEEGTSEETTENTNAESNSPDSTPTSLTRATPEFLRIVDSDADTRFDRLEITYSETITGSVALSGVFLYSDTGGLFESKTNTASWFFFESSVSGSVLTLFLTGNILSKTSLKVDSSVSSQLRLKSLADFGLVTLSSGLSVTPFGLTTSFSEYAKERISFFPEPPAPVPPPTVSVAYLGGSSTLSATPTLSLTGNGAFSGASASGAAASVLKTASKRKAPDISKKTLSASKPKTQKTSGGTSSWISSADQNSVPISIVPSSGVDLLPSGKFRYECFSKTCPVSFKVEKPSNVSGYWLFPDGRKRYGTTTGTLGKTFARYRLSYVVSKKNSITRHEIDLSVVPALEPSDDAVIAASASVAAKKLAASKTSATSTASKSSSTATKNAPKAAAVSKTKPLSEKSGTKNGTGAGEPFDPSTPDEKFFVALATVSSLVLVVLIGWHFVSSRLEAREMDPVELSEPKEST